MASAAPITRKIRRSSERGNGSENRGVQDRDETGGRQNDHGEGNQARSNGACGERDLGLGPFEQDNVAAGPQIDEGVDRAAQQQCITGFQPDFAELGANHAAAALDAERDGAGEAAETQHLDRAADHARAGRNDGFG